MLEAHNISKHFGGVKALSNVSMKLQPGEVNAIIGENGAGKSTLMKIFSGVHTDYEGEMLYKGKAVRFQNPRDAESCGIAIIHQELNLVPHMSIAANIFLGRESSNAIGMLDHARMKEETHSLLQRVHLNVPAHTLVETLKVGEQQLVEIAKALHADAEVIIMDEPTSAISDREVEQLYNIICELKSDGKTIAYISHKLKELFKIADRFIVLRDGETVDDGSMKEITPDQLIERMTGRKISFQKTGNSQNGGKDLLIVRNLGLRHPILKAEMVFDQISFALKKGEILGVYGLMGAGRTELMETIFGMHPTRIKGEILLHGKKVTIACPADAINAGIALVPEDRKGHGLILDESIRRNISLPILKILQRFGLIVDTKKEKELSANSGSRLQIKTNNDGNAAKSLSGGNQQKVVLAKWLATKPEILLLDEPTRGIDINAKAEIYKLMKELAKDGMGIIMVSSELPEILAVSDRVLVLCEGSLTASVPVEEATEAGLLKFAIHKNELAT